MLYPSDTDPEQTMMQRAGEARQQAEYSDHLARIRAIVSAWHRGEIGVDTKRARIAEENAAFYEGGLYGGTGYDITQAPVVHDELLTVLTERSGAPAEAVSAALAAGQSAAWRAAHADDLASARAALAEGREGYQQIMRSAS